MFKMPRQCGRLLFIPLDTFDPSSIAADFLGGHMDTIRDYISHTPLQLGMAI